MQKIMKSFYLNIKETKILKNILKLFKSLNN